MLEVPFLTHTTMTSHTTLRESWKKFVDSGAMTTLDYEKAVKATSDWWLNELDKALSSSATKIREGVKQIADDFEMNDPRTVRAMEELILALLPSEGESKQYHKSGKDCPDPACPCHEGDTNPTHHE